LDAKENALRIIAFDRPAYMMSEPPLHEIAYHGCNHEGFDGGGDESPIGSKWMDIWGTGWEKIHESMMGLPVENPLAEIKALQDYRWPNPKDERICGKIYKLADVDQPGDRFLTGSHRDTLWEKAYMLVGMENMMVYFLTEPGFAREVLHHIMDFQLGIAEHYLKLGVEFVRLGDDLGSQRGLLLSPEIVDRFLRPEYERLCHLYRERDILIWFHSCGYVEPLLEMFIQLGVKILNPVQATANNLNQIRAVTQGRMALHGGVNSAIMMDGPLDRIIEEARGRIWQLGQQGGYFCSPDQGLPYPEAHLCALHEAIEECGRYPLLPPQ
jgi:uroporphyrinogen decarboxylase